MVKERLKAESQTNHDKRERGVLKNSSTENKKE